MRGWWTPFLRWYTIKVFERDDKVMAQLNLTGELKAHLEAHIADCEKEMDDDAESIITNQRYTYINGGCEQGREEEGGGPQPDHL